MSCFKLNNFRLLFLLIFTSVMSFCSTSLFATQTVSSDLTRNQVQEKEEQRKEVQEKKVQGKEIQATVTLNSIEAKKLSKKSGDKLYINITESSNLGKTTTTRMPEKPTLSFSKNSAQFKNLILWTGRLKENEEVKLIFSIVEEDFSAWDIDDLIGSAQLILTNKKGHLEKRWELPVFEENTVMVKKGASPEFVMKGEHSHYVVSFSLEEKPSL